MATAKQLGSIENEYEELKQELGLMHYKERGWRGDHPGLDSFDYAPPEVPASKPPGRAQRHNLYELLLMDGLILAPASIKK